MSDRTRNTIEILVALLPWLAFLVAVVVSLALEVRDELREHRAGAARGTDAAVERRDAHGRA